MDQLIPLRKGGVTLDVHHTCVQAHADAGWQLADESAAETEARREHESAAADAGAPRSRRQAAANGG